MGWNGSENRNAAPVPKKANTPPSKWRGLIALAVIVIGGFAAWIALRPAPPAPPAPSARHQAPGAIAEATPSIPTNAPAPKLSGEAGRKSAEDVIADMESAPKNRIKVRALTPAEWLSITNRAFSTAAEQMMSWVFTVEPGDPPPPIMPIGEEDIKNIAAILISKNEIKDSDTDFDAFSKEQVDRAKKEMAKYIGEGGDPNEFLRYYHEELKLMAQKRQEAMDQLAEVEEEEPALAKDFRKKINNYLESQGIKTLPEPSPEKETENSIGEEIKQ